MQNYNCKNCGAELYWDPNEGCLKCQYCGNKYQPSDFQDNTLNDEIVIDESVETEYTEAAEAAQENPDMVVYECKNCRGEVVALKGTMATICPYCGEAISITSKSVGNFRPRACIPFKIDKKKAKQLFEEFAKEVPLTPKEFKAESTIEKIQGLFVPFYLHDMKSIGSYKLSGEKDSSSYRSGDDKVVITDVYDLSVAVESEYTNVPTDGSKNIDNEYMKKIEPFKYESLKEYNPAYMSGYYAEQPDEEEDSLKLAAEKRVEEEVEKKAKSEFAGYSNLKIKSKDLEFTNHDTKYVMMPVWFLNVKWKGDRYQFAVNGQTGKIVGDLPLNKKALGIHTTAFFFIFHLILCFVFSFFI